MFIIIDTSNVDEDLKIEIEKINVKNRQFEIFAYNTIFHDKSIKDLKSEKISKERALFPTMNPNLFRGFPSIFSCKTKLRVNLNPGDVIFCFPKKSKKMNDYFSKYKKEKPPELCITLVMIVIKQIELENAFNLLTFKSCKNKSNIEKNEQWEFTEYTSDLKQVGDITARYVEGKWEYLGDEKGPHFHNTNDVKSLNDDLCPYKKHLENDNPYPKLGCKQLKCSLYEKQCKMKRGTWKYDILFKWGLLGSLNKTIPLEFRSFYLGSAGMPLNSFAEESGNTQLIKNSRYYDKETLNKNGSKILENLRKVHNIK